MVAKGLVQLSGDHEQILRQIRQIRLSDRKERIWQILGILLCLCGFGIVLIPFVLSVLWPSYLDYAAFGLAVVGLALIFVAGKSKIEHSHYEALERIHNILVAKHSAHPPFSYRLELRSPESKEFLADSASDRGDYDRYPRVSTSTFRCTMVEASTHMAQGEKLKLTVVRKTVVKSTTTRKFLSPKTTAHESNLERWNNESVKIEKTYFDEVSVNIVNPDPTFSYPERPRCEHQAESESAPVGFAGPLPSSKAGSSALFYQYQADGHSMQLSKEFEVSSSDFTTKGVEYLLDETQKQLQMAEARSRKVFEAATETFG